jgi:hypothetical protein
VRDSTREVGAMGKVYVLNGPEIGRSFELRDGVSFLGRALDNDIRIEDRTVSRKHLKVTTKADKHFITDLKSRNGTFIKGEFVSPGAEVEVEEGIPLAIGLTVICLGKGCKEQMMPFLDSIEPPTQAGELNETFGEHRDRPILKKLEFLHKVSNVFSEELPLKEALEKILDHIFDHLKRIDRGAFVLIDSETEGTKEIIYKSNKPGDDTTTVYCQDIVSRVITNWKPVVISDAKTEESEFSDTLEVLKIESVMCVPLICGSEILGAIYVDSLERPYGFRREDLFLFLNLGQRIGSAIEDAQFASDILEVAEALSADKS